MSWRLIPTASVGLLFLVGALGYAETVHVIAEKANLRSQPSTDSAIVAPLNKGTVLDVIETSGMWLRVKVRATAAEGYIHSALVGPVAASAAPMPTAPPTVQAPTTPEPRPASAEGGGRELPRAYILRVIGGLYSAVGFTGFGVGGGIAGRPFGNDKTEVQGDFTFIRIGGINAYEGSANFFYNFRLSDQKFTPVAGAGIVFARFGFGEYSASEITFQLVGAIEARVAGGRAFRAEVRAQFFSGAKLVAVLGGMSF